MRKERLAVAHSIANELIPYEQELDAAIIRNAKLTMAIIDGRRRARAPLTIAQRSLENVALANVRLIEARNLIHEAHYDLREAQYEIGLGAVSYGDYGDTPPPPPAVMRHETRHAVDA
ncbi:hypothetical protein [Sphingomonas sp. SORGH_AS_0879]|uniref:hypothetical protein n=1 Tax=Sphingomonas sp. SORGH_AS_0879 TaxID=3041790 RepID=UPI002788413B|nr:hypothetical protein [Sphingomonas sp. SORGH_AS_0879]MDQ1231714.1 hypothetical protein [Sphingomonas sp. SORGH_AS_0879]